MARRFSSVGFIAFLMAHGPSFAAEKIVATIGAGDDNGASVTFASFAYESCPEECHVATLTCSGNVILVELGDVSAENAAKAITQEQKQIELRANGKRFNYTIRSMQFAEMTGSWWLSASEQGSAVGAIPAAISATKTIEMQAGKMKVALPVDKSVQAWAMACR